MRIFSKRAVKSPQRRGPPLASGGWELCHQTLDLFSIQRISIHLVSPALIFVSI